MANMEVHELTFAGTNSFNTNINGWDVEEVVNMNNMFKYLTNHRLL